MKRLVLMLLFVFILLTFSSIKLFVENWTSTLPSNKAQESEQVVVWARDNLPQTGVLKEGGGGFVYLKVDDGYINELFPLLKHPNYIKPSYFRQKDSPGAHISVIYGGERKQTGAINEIGQSFSFTLSDVDFVPPRYREYIVLQVKSSELEALREKYGLSPLLKGHAFHITIAKKKKQYHRN